MKTQLQNSENAVGYYGGQVDLITLDWFEINLKGYPKLNSKIFNFELQENETRHMKYLYKVFYDSTLIGEFSTCSKNSFLSPDTSFFKFENYVLYTFDIDTLKFFIDNLLFETCTKFNNFVRVDLALDTNSVFVNEFIELFKNNKIHDKGRIQDFNFHFHQKKINGKNLINQINFGSKFSSKYAKLYNKSLELETSNKLYIKDYFNNNFGTDKNIWRLEFTLKSKFFKDLEYFNWKDIFHIKKQVNLIKLCKKNFFEFVYTSSKKRNDSKDEYKLIDFDLLISSKKRITKRKILKVKTKSKISQMLTARAFFKEYIFSTQDNNYLIPFLNVLQRYDLFNDVKKRLKYWIPELMNDLIEKYDFDEFYFNKCFNNAQNQKDILFTSNLPIYTNNYYATK